MTQNARAFRRLFTRKYLIGLFLLAGLSCASLYIMYEQNARQAGRAELINLAFGQKALSQRISFFANALVTAESAGEQQLIRSELEIAVAEMLQAHETLSSQSPSIGRAPIRIDVLEQLYFDGEAPFDEDVRTFLKSASELARAPASALQPDSLLLKEVNLLGMHTIMQTHDVITHIISHEAEREIAFAKVVQSTLTGLILLLLAAEAIFIFEPVGRAIESSIRKAQRSEQLAQDEARRANQAHDAKSNFLRVMSHEFRTPLNAVIGMTDLLRATAMNEQQRVYVRHLQDAGHHMLLLANDILTVQQHSAGKLQLSMAPTDLANEIEGVVGLLTPKASEKGLVLTFARKADFHALVMIDATRFRQVLINLIGNAIKFTQKGRITVTAASAPVEAPQGDGVSNGRVDIEIRVIDTGAGVSPDKREKIFEEFEQAETFGERSSGGAGLGLAISRSIVEALGGKLVLESSSDQGSVFLISMRLFTSKADLSEAPASPAVSPPSRVAAACAGATILVVDDNLPNRMIAAAYLKKAGHKVVFAENGEQALAALCDDADIAMAFMDIEMPVMDGVAATKALRNEKEPRVHIPVIALTAHALPEDSERLLACGFDEVLRKPIKESDIVDCAQRYVANRTAA